MHNNKEYLLANRSTKLFALVATLVMTELNTSGLVGFSSLGYEAGHWTISLAAIFLVGLLFYALVAAKKWKQYNGYTVTTFFSERYNNAMGLLAAFILFATMLGFTANYVKSLGLIFQALMPNLSMWLITAILTVVMLLLTLRGGLVSIIRFDVVSFILVLIIFPSWIYFANNMPVHHASVTISWAVAQQKLPISYVFH